MFEWIFQSQHLDTMKDFSQQSTDSVGRFRDLIRKGKDVVLPGHEGLELLTDNPHYLVPSPPDARQAAVVLMVHASNGYPSLLFIQRADHIHEDKHKGQIAFPGGKQEENESLKECALREMEEEIGISLPPDHLTQKLTPLYVAVSNYLVHPFVAFQETIPGLRPNPEEVSAIIDSPLTELKNRYGIRRKDMRVRDMILKKIPYYEVGGQTLWGASALIFAEFLCLLDQHQ